MNVQKLPNEILVIILTKVVKLHQGLVKPCKLVCKQWQTIVLMLSSSKNIQKLYMVPRTIGNYIQRGYVRKKFILWLRGLGYSESDVCLEITKLNLPHRFKWAYQQKFPLDRRIYSTASSVGSLDILNWLYDRNIKPNQQSLLRSVDSGSVDVIKWFLDRKCGFHPRLYNLAAKHGHVEIINWLLDHNYYFYDNVMCDAVENGYLEIVKIFMKQEVPILTEHRDLAAQYGQLNVLKYIVNLVGKPNFRTCNRAAKGGHTKILEWISKHYPGMILLPECLILKQTLVSEKFEAFKWAIDQDCPVDVDICQRVIRTGNLELFKWFYYKLHVQVPLIWQNLCHYAKLMGYFNIGRWLDTIIREMLISNY